MHPYLLLSLIFFVIMPIWGYAARKHQNDHNAPAWTGVVLFLGLIGIAIAGSIFAIGLVEALNPGLNRILQ